jgi:hypothetical protein
VVALQRVDGAFACGIAPDNEAGTFVDACTISRAMWRGPAGSSRRKMIGSSLSVGLCAACLDGSRARPAGPSHVRDTEIITAGHQGGAHRGFQEVDPVKDPALTEGVEVVAVSRFRILLLAIITAVGITTVPAVALATTTVTYAVSGFEYAASPTVGSFAGGAVAPDDFGAWQARVVHGYLPTNPGGTAPVTGGSFALDGHARDLAGAIDGGTITLLTTSTCGKQTYSVTGHLVLAPSGTGDAAFAMLLSHYRLLFFGRCITYGATVHGSVTFHLSA